MTPRDSQDYLADLLTSAREVKAFTRGMSFARFEKDRKTINAVIRSLEVMGEAAKQIPEDLKRRHPEIPWKRMAGMRDKLIHEYSGVDLEIVWTVLREELPPLVPLLKSIYREVKKSDL